tara:strand:+ start:108 stop:503 length:396 start_codon:yes stop_codon:yes gene_type:complete
MTNVLDHAALEKVAEQAIGHYGWLLIAAFCALLFKDILFNFAQGLLIYWGSDFENDEILYISGRQARVIRLGLTSTTFFMTDRNTKMIVPNEQLKALVVEKRLPVNGGEAYLPKGDEGGVMKVELVKDGQD